MTRRAAVVAALVPILLALLVGPAVAAGKYCGTASKTTATRVTYFVVTLDDGRHLMQTRHRLSRTPSYYTCGPTS